MKRRPRENNERNKENSTDINPKRRTELREGNISDKREQQKTLGKVEKKYCSLKEYKVRHVSICKLAPKGQSNPRQSWVFADLLRKLWNLCRSHIQQPSMVPPDIIGICI